MLKKLIRVLAVVSLVALLTAAAQLAYTSFVQPAAIGDTEWYVFSRDVGWEPKPHFKGTVYGAEREFDARGFLLADAPKQAAATGARVVFLGDSTTFGTGVPIESTFAALTEHLVPGVHTVNFAVPGYTAYQGYLRLLKYADEVHPDVVVAAFNFNDRRYVLDGRFVDGPSKFETVYRLHQRNPLDQLLAYLRLYRTTGSIATTVGWIESVDLRNVRARVSPDAYRHALVNIASWGKRRRAAVIFVLLHDSPSATADLRRGISEAAAGQLERAVETLQGVITRNDEFAALARMRLSDAYRQLGRIDQAEDALQAHKPLLSLHGGYPVHLDTEYTRIATTVAEESGAVVIDAGSALDATPGYYTDYCHFDERGHRLIAELLAQRLPGVLRP